MTRVLALLLILATPAAAANVRAPELWITLGSDAVPVLADALAKQGWSAATHVLKTQGGVSVARIREDMVPAVSRAMHERFFRCAGFVVHASRAAALQALDAESRRQAAEDVTFVQYTIDNAAVVQSIHASLSAARIASTIESLAAFHTRYYTTATGVSAATWVRDLWRAQAGKRGDVTVELFSHAGFVQPSVILTVRGTTLPAEVVVLGAHLDSTNSSGAGLRAPGADDDASGVATLTEVLGASLGKGFRPQRTVKFIAYAAEEVGLRGSSEIANAFRSANVNVVGVLQLDMTNYRGSAVDMGILSDRTNSAQNQFLIDLIGAYTQNTWSLTQCGYACSDHASWTTAGYPASLPFEALMGEHNQALHSTSDTLATSGGTGDHSLKFAKLAAAYLAELAKGTIGAN